MLATSTASGKSLCYQVPIIEAALRDPRSRALMLFPTKALGRDQVESLRTLGSHPELHDGSVGVAVYDGDTPPDARRAARRRAHAVATNPDMLHRGILPHHDRWASFLAGLRYVVLDELHTYRGLFGSHVANVLRRLFRLCAHHGASPTVIACSATIANPGELAAMLCGRPFEVIAADTAPAGPRTFAVLNPRVVDEVTGVRRDYLKVTRAVTSELRRAGVQTLAFCRTRKAVELLTRYMREDEQREVDAGAGGDPDAIRGYRGGYLPERRREVEQALRDGAARVVASTNALELGIDIGGVDAVVLSGYPGTRAATLQRAGRAGRRGRPALTVLCLSSMPLDQFVGVQPSFLWGEPPEHARVDPDNPEVLLPHLRCAAFELAFSLPAEGEGAVGLPGLEAGALRAGLDHLAEQGGLYREVVDDAVVYAAAGSESPAERVDLRGTIEENFAVIEEATGDVLAQVDFEDAPLYLHPGAIYGVEGHTYEVRSLDWVARKAYVRRSTADYYTEAVVKTRGRVRDAPEADAATVQPACGQGFAHVVRTVPGFKKIRFGTHENIGYGPVSLPDLELHTTSAYWKVPIEGGGDDPQALQRRAATALAAAHALHHVAAMVLMCDVGDLGSVVTAGHPSAWGPTIVPGGRASTEAIVNAGALPYLVLYDKQPGGAGLATTAFAMGAGLFERVAQVVSGCACAKGCPTCMGPSSDDAWEVDRADVVRVLQAIARRNVDVHEHRGEG